MSEESRDPGLVAPLFFFCSRIQGPRPSTDLHAAECDGQNCRRI